MAHRFLVLYIIETAASVHVACGTAMSKYFSVLMVLVTNAVTCDVE